LDVRPVNVANKIGKTKELGKKRDTRGIVLRKRGRARSRGEGKHLSVDLFGMDERAQQEVSSVSQKRGFPLGGGGGEGVTCGKLKKWRSGERKTS